VQNMLIKKDNRVKKKISSQGFVYEYNDGNNKIGMAGLTPRKKLAGSLFDSICLIQPEKVTLTLQAHNY